MNIEILFLILNIILFLGSKQLFGFLYKNEEKEIKYRTYLSFWLSGMLLVLQAIHYFASNLLNNDLIENTLYSVASIYFALIFQAIVHYIIRLKLGEQKEIDGVKVVYDSPTSRMWSIMSIIIITFYLIYTNIQIWSAASLMETTGIIGLTLGALALTNGVWFPDIYNGIVILKSNAFDVGETIVIEDDVYTVYKISFFNVVLLDINKNNRTIMPNRMFSSLKIENISKAASGRGLRNTIIYKIGYPEKNINEYIQKFKEMVADVRSQVNEEYFSSHDFGVMVNSTGDYAIEMIVSFYTKPIPKTFTTENIRDYLLKPKQIVNECMLIKSYEYEIDLSTPMLNVIQVEK